MASHTFRLLLHSLYSPHYHLTHSYARVITPSFSLTETYHIYEHGFPGFAFETGPKCTCADLHDTTYLAAAFR